MEIYIVGGGSFAEYCLNKFLTLDLTVRGFIDEFREGPWLGLPVYRADELSSLNIRNPTLFISCISAVEHQQAAVERIKLNSNSSVRVFSLFDHIDCDDLCELEESGYTPLQTIFANGLTGIGDLETYVPSRIERRYANDKRFAEGPHLSASFFGPAYGYRQHLMPILKEVHKEYNVTTMTASPLLDEDAFLNPIILPLPKISEIEGFDLAIAAHFMHSSPPDTTRVTFFHVLGDVLSTRYETGIEPYLVSANTHYLFVPNIEIFTELKQLITERNYDNNLILVPGGYPNLDNNYDKISELSTGKDCLIFAPTFSCTGNDPTKKAGHANFSMGQSCEILVALSTAYPDKTIIYRPHPGEREHLNHGIVDFFTEAFLQSLKTCEELENCVLDEKPEYFNQYARSECMISDYSSTAYTFAYITEQPVIFFAPSNIETPPNLAKTRYFQNRTTVGELAYDIPTLLKAVGSVLENQHAISGKIRKLRDDTIFNFGRSSGYFMENIDYMLENKQHPDWWYSQGSI